MQPQQPHSRLHEPHVDNISHNQQEASRQTMGKRNALQPGQAGQSGQSGQSQHPRQQGQQELGANGFSNTNANRNRTPGSYHNGDGNGNGNYNGNSKVNRAKDKSKHMYKSNPFSERDCQNVVNHLFGFNQKPTL